MNRLIIILSFTFSINNLFGQDSLLFRKYDFDTSYKILAASSYNKAGNVYYKELSFYISGISDLNDIKKIIKYGKLIEHPAIEFNNLNIYIVKGNQIQKGEIHINPAYSNINIDGKYYYFDIGQLKDLSVKYPISYTSYWTTLKTETELNKFLSSNSSKESFLCYQNNSRPFGGSYDIYIDKSKSCNTGTQAIQVIKQKLLDLGYVETKFLIFYAPTNDETQTFKLTLLTNRDIYEKLMGKEFTKSQWKPNNIEILSYWMR